MKNQGNLIHIVMSGRIFLKDTVILKMGKIVSLISVFALIVSPAVLFTMGCGHQVKKNPLNIVLISLDTVRFDALGCSGNQRAGTPNIDALAREGSYFAEAISTNSLTTPAHCSLFTGRYPTAHGVRNIGVYALPQTEQTLAEFLKEHGYSTAGFVSAFPVSHRFGLSRGFDIYDDRTSPQEKEKESKLRMADIFAERSAAEVADAAIAWMNEKHANDKPFFLFVHFFDAHFPYNPPPEFIQRFGTEPKQRYAGEISYIDSQFVRILSALDQKGVRRNTLFIVTSDHGESFNEHGEDGHGIFIYDATIRIPLFFCGGPIIKGKTFHEQVSIIDIFPTIADLLGFPIPAKLHGRSLKGLLLGTKDHLEDRWCYIESFLPHESFGWAPLVGMRRSSEKLIRAPRSELYDLKDDPLEGKNLYQANRDHAKELEEEFTKFLKTITEESTQASAQLSGEELEQLRSLGYIGAGIKTDKLSGLADPKDRIGLYSRMKAARVKLIGDKDANRALQELKSLEKEDPGNMTVRLLIGQALGTLERTREAEEHYLSLISGYPQFTLALNELASLLMKSQKWEDAAKYYQKSLEINPTQIELYPNFAYILFKMDRVQDASSFLDKALVDNPQETSLHAMCGELAYRTKDYVKAAQHFSVVYKANPDDLEAAQNYARALLPLGNVIEGVQILEPLALRGEKSVEFQLLYGQCLAQAGRLEDGMRCFEKVLSMEERSSAHYFMGLCLLKMGKIDEAEKHFNKLDRNDANYEKSRQVLKSYNRP